MKNENDIKQRFGTHNHFRVPEGYFDKFAADFQAQLMGQGTSSVEEHVQLVPQEAKTVSMRRNGRWRTWAIAAATIAFVMMGGVYWMSRSGVNQPQSLSDTQMGLSHVSSDDSEVDMVADYAMLDATDMYAMLLENNN